MKNQLIGLLVLISISGCYTKKRAIEKFCTQDTAIYHGTIVAPIITIVPPDTARFVLKISELESTVNKLKDLFARQSDSLITLYSDSLHEVTVQIDNTKPVPTTKWEVRDKKPKIIHDTIRVPFEVKIPCNCPSCPEPTKWDGFKTYFTWIMLSFIVAAIIMFVWRK